MYFRPQAGDTRYAAADRPCWADFSGDKMFPGFPDLESRGFKMADDPHGAVFDVDTGDRAAQPADTQVLRAQLARRFPGLAQAPPSESRVCQYTNSASGDFLIDRHPLWANAVLVGMGCGHGFKYGPSVGMRAAALLLTSEAPGPTFTLASKSVVG
jgi:glycine/D-amino acid oxidase-like deaminating enzyme